MNTALSVGRRTLRRRPIRQRAARKRRLARSAHQFVTLYPWG